ncbi:MAG: hypothetical protein VX699_00335 [Myxococcota bacterium]|nr:hypothetical protein [Myxococcota bacterium]
MRNLSAEERRALANRYPEDDDIKTILKRLASTEDLLERSLYEFGSELRMEIEKLLGKPGLLDRC